MATKSSAKSSRGKRKLIKRVATKSTAKKTAAKSKKTAAPKKKRPFAKVGKAPKPSRRSSRRSSLSSKKAPTKKTSAKKSSVGKKTTAPAPRKVEALKAPPKSPLLQLIEAALADMKAVNVTVLDVRGLTDVADSMVIASGNSDRHVRSIADNVLQQAKKAGFRPMGVEGERDGEWALVDLQDIIVHVMLPRVREFYRLENLWDISAARRESALSSG